jgi:DNA-binding MarR family transcriptional regulator
MERRGLVVRMPCADDGRGTIAQLTDEGRAALDAAVAGHVGSVRRHVLDRLDERQRAALVELAGLLAD